MDKHIAYCGLDCEKCEAYIATIKDDVEAKKDIAKRWSQMNETEITADMITCYGCKSDGVKTPFCDALCDIRKCAINNELKSCGACQHLKTCAHVKMVMDNNADAKKRLLGK